MPRPLRLYEVLRTPLEIPGDDKYSQLDDLPFAVAYDSESQHYVSFDNEAQIPIGDHLDTRTTSAHLRPHRIPSCLTALLENNINMINALCKYHVIEGRLPTQIIRLSATRIFLSSVSQVTITCDDTQNTTEIAINHSQIVFEIGCQCDLTALDVYLPPIADICRTENETIIELHPINLRVLHEYFSTAELLGLQAETLLRNKINISIPKLLLAAKPNENDLQQQLAFEDKAKFDLQKIINSTKSDKSSFKSLSDYLLNDILQSQMEDSNFDIFNLWHWFYLLCSIAGVAALIFTGILSWKLRTLTAVVFAARIPGMVRAAVVTSTPSIPDVLYYRPSTVATLLANNTLIDRSILEYLKLYLPLEVSIWICIGLACVGATGILAHRFRPTGREETIIGLEIGNTTDYIVLKWLRLPHLPSCYDVSVLNTRTTVSIKELCIISGRIELAINNVILHHNVLEWPIEIPKSKLVLFWTAKRVKAFLQQPHYLMIAVMDDKRKRYDSVLIKSMSPADIEKPEPHWNRAFEHRPEGEWGVVAAPQQPSAPQQLYPTLPETKHEACTNSTCMHGDTNKE